MVCLNIRVNMVETFKKDLFSVVDFNFLYEIQHFSLCKSYQIKINLKINYVMRKGIQDICQ